MVLYSLIMYLAYKDVSFFSFWFLLSQKIAVVVINYPDGPSSQFTKHGYQLMTNTSIVLVHYLVHYLGDENMAVHFPHGNTKHNKDHGYVWTSPSVLRKAEKRSMTEQPPKIYKSEITQPVSTPYLSIMQPCNSKQVENIYDSSNWKNRDYHMMSFTMSTSLLMTYLSLFTPYILMAS